MNTNRFALAALAAVALLAVATPTLAENTMKAAASAKPATAATALKAQKARGAASTTSVSGLAKANAAIKVSAPAGKGPKTRAGASVAEVVVDNWTKNFAVITINKKVFSMVSPFGKNTIVLPPGTWVVEAKAELADGSTATWGPSTKELAAGDTSTVKLED